MNFKVLVLVFSILSVQGLYAQGGRIESNYNMIGLKRSFTNLHGNLSPIGVKVSESNRSALLNYSSDYAFGVSFETLNHFKRNKRWTLMGEVGLYFVGGDLSFKALNRSTMHTENGVYKFEMERQTQFRSLYLFTGGKVGYTLPPRHNLSLVFGPKIAGRINNNVTSQTYSFVHEHETDPEFSVWRRTNTSDEDDDLIPMQLFFSVGAFKSFSFKNRKIFVGLEYDRSVLNLHNRGNLKSHMISVSIKYAWAKSQ